MPLGDSVIERAPGTWSEKTAIEKPAGSRMRSSGRWPASPGAACGAEQASSTQRTANLKVRIVDFGSRISMVFSLARIVHSAQDEPHSHGHQSQGHHLGQGQLLAEEDPTGDHGHEVADAPLQSFDGTYEDEG